MLQIKKFNGSAKEIIALADIYMRSYNKLSENYKSKEEMALYTKGFFIKKLKTWSNNQQQGKEPFIYVLYNGENPCGIMRFNEIPASYRQMDDNLISQEKERGQLDGWEILRNRKIQYHKDPQYASNTLILNQIYLAPEAQKKGWGTYFIKNVIPQLQQAGYEEFIVEYNDNNANGKKFHQNVLCAKEIAHTTDFDHIINKDANSQFCLSPVTIGKSNFSSVLENISRKEKFFEQAKGRQ
jgi:hypothetical protein